RLFSKRKADMLVVIGRVLGKADAHTCSHLPSAWRTLYCLARIGFPILGQLIREGRIHPNLTLAQAEELLAEFRPDLLQQGAGSSVERRLARFSAFVQETISNWSSRERRIVHTELLRLAALVERTQKERATSPKLSRSPRPAFKEPDAILPKANMAQAPLTVMPRTNL